MRLTALTALAVLTVFSGAIHAETKLAKWTLRAMVAGYCAASAMDGWQSTRPGIVETNPLLRTADGSASVPRMVTFKVGTCAAALVASHFTANGKRGKAASAGVSTLLGIQVLTDVHNAKVAK